MNIKEIDREYWYRFLRGREPQPDGENFFLIRVRLDTRDDILWDNGFNIAGNWNGCRTLLRQQIPIDRDVHIQILQGKKAREQFACDVAEERRYREQMKARPNN